MHSLRLSEIIYCTGGRLVKLHHPSEINGSTIKGISTDTRTIRPGDLFIALKGGNFDGHNFLVQAEQSGARALMISHPLVRFRPGGINVPLIQVADTIQALGEIARYYRSYLKAKFIAVTGSNGKTTTKEMIYHILSRQYRALRSPKSFNNFIGVPLTMFNISPSHQYAIFELGTNRPGEIPYLANIVQPDVVVITNIGPTHLAGLGSIAGVAKAKASLLKFLEPEGIAVVPCKDKWLEPYLLKSPCKIITFGNSAEADICANHLSHSPSGLTFKVNNKSRCFLPVLGSWNMLNAACALAVTSALGVNIKTAIRSLRDFRSPEMRMNREEYRGVTFINDAYNANPVSVGRLLSDLKKMKTAGRKILILGEMRELGKYSVQYHREIADKIAQVNPDAVWLVGAETKPAVRRLNRKYKKIETYFSATPDGVMPTLSRYLEKDDLVVFKGSRALGLETVLEQVKKGIK